LVYVKTVEPVLSMKTLINQHRKYGQKKENMAYYQDVIMNDKEKYNSLKR